MGAQRLLECVHRQFDSMTNGKTSTDIEQAEATSNGVFNALTRHGEDDEDAVVRHLAFGVFDSFDTNQAGKWDYKELDYALDKFIAKLTHQLPEKGKQMSAALDFWNRTGGKDT